MDFLFSLVISPAALAVLILAVYYIYPSPLVLGYMRFGGYILCGLQRKSLQVEKFFFSYYERPHLPATYTDNQGTASQCPATLLFLHGFTSNKESWVRVTQNMPKDWRIVVLDMPGHGESSFDTRLDYSPLGMAEKVHKFVQGLNLKSFHLVGESLGALVSAAYASQYPERLQSLTTLCPPITHRLIGGKKTQFLQEFELTGSMSLLFPKCPDEFQQMINYVLYNPSMFTFHYRMRQTLVYMQMQHYPNFDKIQKDLLRTQEGDEDVRRLAKSITMPALILWGQHDRICDPSGGENLHALVQDSELHILERCGHAITLERPRKCAKLITDFISKHNRR